MRMRDITAVSVSYTAPPAVSNTAPERRNNYCSNIHGSRMLCTILRITLYYWSREQWTPSRHARSLRHGTGHGGGKFWRLVWRYRNPHS